MDRIALVEEVTTAPSVSSLRSIAPPYDKDEDQSEQGCDTASTTGYRTYSLRR